VEHLTSEIESTDRMERARILVLGVWRERACGRGESRCIARIDELMCQGIGETPDEAIAGAFRQAIVLLERDFTSRAPPRALSKMLVTVEVPRTNHLSPVANGR
jgi:hypothetical protein